MMVDGDRGPQWIRITQVLSKRHAQAEPAVRIPGDLPGSPKQVLLPLYAPREEEHAIPWGLALSLAAFPIHEYRILQRFIEADLPFKTLSLPRRSHGLRSVIQFDEEIELTSVAGLKLHRSVRLQRLATE